MAALNFPVLESFDETLPENQPGQRLSVRDHRQHRQLQEQVEDWNEMLEDMPRLHVWVWCPMPPHIVTNTNWTERYDHEREDRAILQTCPRNVHSKHYYVAWVKRVQLASDGSGQLEVIDRQRLFCRVESLNPEAFAYNDYASMDCRNVLHFFNALAEKDRPAASWLVWTQMRVVLLDWTFQVSFEVVTMTGKTIWVTCQVMRLITEVCDLIKAQLWELTDKNLMLCKGTIVMEPHETLLLHDVKSDDVLTVVVTGLTDVPPEQGPVIP
jgi:hypothetical protein